MEFRIADTFTDRLVRLTGDEQKSVKTTAFDLQLNPANPGMQFHKLDKARDKSFWSVRVSGDIRLIVHRAAASLLLCCVDHHGRVTAHGPAEDRSHFTADRRSLQQRPLAECMDLSLDWPRATVRRQRLRIPITRAKAARRLGAPRSKSQWCRSAP